MLLVNSCHYSAAGHSRIVKIDNHKVKIQGNRGNVEWHQHQTLKSDCRPNMRHFPRDIQECELRFQSQSFTGEEVGSQWVKGRNNILVYLECQRVNGVNTR